MALGHEHRGMCVGGVLNPYVYVTATRSAAILINAFQLQAQETLSATNIVKIGKGSNLIGKRRLKHLGDKGAPTRSWSVLQGLCGRSLHEQIFLNHGASLGERSRFACDLDSLAPPVRVEHSRKQPNNNIVSNWSLHFEPVNTLHI